MNLAALPREMLEYVTARRKEEWDHTSKIVAMMCNSNPFRSGPLVHDSDFHPLRRGVDVEMTQEEYREYWYAKHGKGLPSDVAQDAPG